MKWDKGLGLHNRMSGYLNFLSQLMFRVRVTWQKVRTSLTLCEQEGRVGVRVVRQKVGTS